MSERDGHFADGQSAVSSVNRPTSWYSKLNWKLQNFMFSGLFDWSSCDSGQCQFCSAACNFKVFVLSLQCGAKRPSRPRKKHERYKTQHVETAEAATETPRREANNNKNIKLKNTFNASEKEGGGRGAEKRFSSPRREEWKIKNH